jgi:hypothetical protein
MLIKKVFVLYLNSIWYKIQFMYAKMTIKYL